MALIDGVFFSREFVRHVFRVTELWNNSKGIGEKRILNIPRGLSETVREVKGL